MTTRLGHTRARPVLVADRGQVGFRIARPLP